MDSLLIVLVVGVVALVALLLGWWIGNRPVARLEESSSALSGERDLLRDQLGRAEKAHVAAQGQADHAGLLRRSLDEVARERDTAMQQAASLRPTAARAENLDLELARIRDEKEELSKKIASHEKSAEMRNEAHAAQIKQMGELRVEVEARFRELASQAVEAAHDQFLKRADQKFTATGAQNEEKLNAILQPVKSTLERYEKSVTEIERARTDSYGALREQLTLLRDGQEKVVIEAQRLRTTLRSSSGDVGRWGEQQCENVLERAGLQEGIDFEKQLTSDLVGDRSRPDFVVNLPGGRKLIVDVKCSLDAYIGAVEADDDLSQQRLLTEHAKAIRRHAEGLTSKAYQNRFGDAGSFVVMFVPGENFLHAALKIDRDLLAWGHGRNVVILGPTNLVSLALTISALRGQEKLAERAEEIGKAGRRLYENLSTLGKNSHAMANSMRSVVSNWNRLVGTIDGGLLSTARKFDELGAGKASPDVRELDLLEELVREPQKLTATIPEDGLPAPSEG